MTRRDRVSVIRRTDAAEYEALLDRAELLDDVRRAEAEVAAGRGLAQSKAKAAVLARLHA